jgi:hypothetical protein
LVAVIVIDDATLAVSATACVFDAARTALELIEAVSATDD